MSDIGGLIKELAVNAIEAGKPSDIVIGTVIDYEDLKVRLEQKLILTGDFIDVCKGAIFSEGDGVALIRYGGGQRYVLIDGIRGDNDGNDS